MESLPKVGKALKDLSKEVKALSVMGVYYSHAIIAQVLTCHGKDLPGNAEV